MTVTHFVVAAAAFHVGCFVGFVVLLIVDSRRPFTEEEHAAQQWDALDVELARLLAAEA